MRNVLAGLFLLVCIGMVNAQGATRSYSYDVALDIDAHGQVAQVTLPDGLPAPFSAPLREAAVTWRFEAPVRDGKAQSYLREG